MAFGSAFKSAWNSATSYARQKTAEVATGAKAVGVKALEKVQMTADKAVAAAKWSADMTNKAATAAADQAAKAAAAAKAQANQAAAAVKAQANKAAVAVKAQAAKTATSLKTQAGQALNKAKETFNNVTRHPVVNCAVQATIKAADQFTNVADALKKPIDQKGAANLLKAVGGATRKNIGRLAKTFPHLKPLAKDVGRLTSKKYTAPILKKLGKVGKFAPLLTPVVNIAETMWERHAAGKSLKSDGAKFDYAADLVRAGGSIAGGALATAGLYAVAGSVLPGPGTAAGFAIGLTVGIIGGIVADKAIEHQVEKPLKDKYFKGD